MGTVAQGQGGVGEHALANGVQIAGRGQVHDRVGPGILADAQLVLFLGRFVEERRGADIGV